MKNRKWFVWGWLGMLAFLFVWLGTSGTGHTAGPYDLSAASFLGDGADNDIRGAVIQTDGTVVLAANLGTAVPSGLTPILLNGATASSGGVIVRLAPDGQTVLSVTRLAAQVLDLSVDGDDNLTVALWEGGAVQLNPTAEAVTWKKTPGKVSRLDTAENGDTAVLVTTSNDPDSDAPGSGTIYLYDQSGQAITTFAGYRNTLDVCVDDATQRVMHIGWNQASANLQVAYVRGRGYDGQTKWTAYDWSTSEASATNSTADTRGYRCDVGADGKLYAAFEAAGGNHIFRYLPFDNDQPANIVGGDKWHEFYNTGSEHKTFFARYDPTSGAYLRGQQFVNRLSSGKGNTVRPRAITADAEGRVYLGGVSASGLPLPPAYTAQSGEVAFNPFAPEAYLGGAWLLVMSSDFQTRLYHTRLMTNGQVQAIGVRQLDPFDTAANFVWAGYTGKFEETYVQDGVQPTAGGGARDGHFGVIAPLDSPPPPPELTKTLFLPLVTRP